LLTFKPKKDQRRMSNMPSQGSRNYRHWDLVEFPGIPNELHDRETHYDV
jgi:hypothetical protein